MRSLFAPLVTDPCSFANCTGIVNVTRTPLGKLLMRQWFIRPSLELGVIEARHDAVECFARNENRTAERPELHGLGDSH